jgi:hypothetical protein
MFGEEITEAEAQEMERQALAGLANKRRKVGEHDAEMLIQLRGARAVAGMTSAIASYAGSQLASSQEESGGSHSSAMEQEKRSGTLSGHPGVGQESPVPGVPSTSSQSLVDRQRGQYGVRREHTPWVAANIRKGKARARQQSSFGVDEEEEELSGYCDFGEPFRQVVSLQESLREFAKGVKAENLSADEPM